ncbi:MAG: hypothetical protein HY292_11775 [Planctomycetes bacterium]|nr:hypothetical protein [Planctomycetota bacterium]
MSKSKSGTTVSEAKGSGGLHAAPSPNMAGHAKGPEQRQEMLTIHKALLANPQSFKQLGHVLEVVGKRVQAPTKGATMEEVIIERCRDAQGNWTWCSCEIVLVGGVPTKICTPV